MLRVGNNGFSKIGPYRCIVEQNSTAPTVLPSTMSNSIQNLIVYCGPGSSVGIATDYGLDGPGSNPGGDGIFRPSRPALGPTQLPVIWVPGLSRG